MIKAGIFLTIIWFAVFGLCDPGQAWAQEGAASDSTIASETLDETLFGEISSSNEERPQPPPGEGRDPASNPGKDG